MTATLSDAADPGQPASWDNTALWERVCRRHRGAQTELFDRFAPRIRRVLARVLGPDPDLPDLLQEVFVQALASVHTLDDPERLGAWLTSVAVFTARVEIRRRTRRRWLSFHPTEKLPEVAARGQNGAGDAVQAVYRVLSRLPADERVAFALWHIEGMEVQELAAACGVSLATGKRRLRRARQRFASLARQEPDLKEWLENVWWGKS